MKEQAIVPTGGGASLIRDLASCNKTTRDRSLKLVLKTWLPEETQLSDDEMKKLWKGLFYCLWHADKAPVQSALIDRLSSLLLSLQPSLSSHYLSAFFLTIRREWPGIDSLRLDKFYLLIRRFLHYSFLMLKTNHAWDLDVSRRLVNLFEEKTFFADDDSKVITGDGVNYHFASIFLDELKPFLPLRCEVLDVLFKPFLCVMSKCRDKVLLGKVKSNVFDVLLIMGRSLLELKKSGEDDSLDGKDEVVVLGSIGLTMGFSAKFYDLGASPDCVQGNRKVLFGLNEGFLRLEKDLALSGIEVSIPDAMVDDDEVPQLVPIATDVEGAAAEEVVLESAGKQKKNNKKSHKASDVRLDGANNKTLKKKKKKKNEGLLEQCSTLAEKDIATVVNGVESSSSGPTGDESNLIFNESVISNLRMQFEKVAEEVGLGIDVSASVDSPEATIGTTDLKKRKRGRSIALKDAPIQDLSDDKDEFERASAAAKGSEKSAKKVRFSMKNNLVWKPQTPLPPQNLRVPPSATPRGSALKKGVPPGPIREITPLMKKVKQKKGRKGIKTISPAIKRLRKLRTLSV
jgi:ribosomal RNA-processing protein 1